MKLKRAIEAAVKSLDKAIAECGDSRVKADLTYITVQTLALQNTMLKTEAERSGRTVVHA